MKKIKVNYILFVLILIAPFHVKANGANKTIALSAAEYELYELIMQYRAEKGLPSIPISPSLTYVAQVHAKDLQNHPPMSPCNLHSWSEYGNWTPCCYTSDHANARLMWSKPRELTSYKGDGYEIAYWNSGGATSQNSLEGWKSSPGHNAVIINQSMWNNVSWRAIGIGIYEEYAVVWFGKEKDNISYNKTYYENIDENTTNRNNYVDVVSNQKIIDKTNKIQNKETVFRRFYNYSGYSSLSYFSVGWAYSFFNKVQDNFSGKILKL